MHQNDSGCHHPCMHWFLLCCELESGRGSWALIKKKKKKQLPSVLQNCLLNLTLPRSLAHGEWKCLVYSCMESARLASLSPRRTVFTPVGCGGWWPLMAGDEPVGSSPCVFAQWLLSLSFLTCWRLNAANFLFEQFLSSSAPPPPRHALPTTLLLLKLESEGMRPLSWCGSCLGPCPMWAVWGLIAEQGHCVFVSCPHFKAFLCLCSSCSPCYLVIGRKCLIAY